MDPARTCFLGHETEGQGASICFKAIKCRVVKIDCPIRLCTASIGPWIYLNFGTSSLTRYWVLPASDRYLLFVYPPLFLLSAVVLIHLHSVRPSTAPLLTIAFLAVAGGGIYCGFVNRGRGWHTDAVKNLRAIAHVAKSRNLHTVVVEEGASYIWGPTLAILDHDLRQLNDPQAADLVVRPDASGLPSISASRP